MTYYRVKLQYDQKPRIKATPLGRICDGIFIRDELYTLREIEEYSNGFAVTERVEIDRCKTYWSFGARFEA